MVFENRNLRDQALDKRLIKVRDGGGLLPDEILEVSDQPHLLVSDNAANFSLLSHVPESEDLVRDGIVVVLLVGFLQELFLQFPEAFIDDLWRQGITLFDHCCDVGLQGFQEVVFFAISRKGIVFFMIFLYTDSTKSLISFGLVERPRSICVGEVPRHFLLIAQKERTFAGTQRFYR